MEISNYFSLTLLMTQKTRSVSWSYHNCKNFEYVNNKFWEKVQSGSTPSLSNQFAGLINIASLILQAYEKKWAPLH